MLFGDGVYFATALNVALTFLKFGTNCNEQSQFSKLGVVLACVADKAHCKREGEQIEGAEGGAIPEHYVVVQEERHIRCDYLLVFVKRRKVTPAAQAEKSGHTKTQSYLRVLSDDSNASLFMLCMLFAIIAFAAWAYLNPRSFTKLLKKMKRK